MELLLNLAWLLLAVPAYWLWQARRQSRRFSSLQCFLALGCLLVVLFPVISATDDLRAMRGEMEESPASKRNLRQASNDKAGSLACHSLVAVSCSSTWIVVDDSSWLQAAPSTLSRFSIQKAQRSPRAPPVPVRA